MSVMRAPDARRMKSGVAPTDLNARTGLSTPPGRIFVARVNSFCDRDVPIVNTQDTSFVSFVSFVSNRLIEP